MTVTVQILHHRGAKAYALVETSGAFGHESYNLKTIFYGKGQTAQSARIELDTYARGFVAGVAEVRRLFDSPRFVEAIRELEDAA